MTESVWNGFRRIDFRFEEREAILILPDCPNKEKNWLFKTEYFGAFPAFEIEMLRRGWHVAFIKNRNRWCLTEDLDLKARFADHLHREYGLYQKCVPVGMSCGGLFACKLAARYPSLVSAMYLDAPVLHIPSVVIGDGDLQRSLLDEFTRATGMSKDELLQYKENPLDQMDVLVDNKIPVMLIYGDADEVVPFSENGAKLIKYYSERGGDITAIGKEGCLHHPHGLEDNTPIIEFVQSHKA